MALVINDRVKETSTTTGTGTFTLAGATIGFETFSSALGDTNTTYYSIVNVNGEFEVGLGTIGAGTLSRDTIISSSNSDAAVDFSAGTKDVFCTLPASKAVILDSSGNINLTGNTQIDGDLTFYNDAGDTLCGYIRNNNDRLEFTNANGLRMFYFFNSVGAPAHSMRVERPLVMESNQYISTAKIQQKEGATGDIEIEAGSSGSVIIETDGNNEINVTNGLVDVTGNITASGTITGNTFSGSGASLTSLNASNLSSGTVAEARLPASALGSVWESKASSFTAEARKNYFVDTSSAALTATLPSSPTIGDEIRFLDVTGTFDTNNLTIARNGNPIQGDASDLTVDTERAGFSLVFYNGTQGWLLTEK